jgi:hypothetical protein
MPPAIEIMSGELCCKMNMINVTIMIKISVNLEKRGPFF